MKKILALLLLLAAATVVVAALSPDLHAALIGKIVAAAALPGVFVVRVMSKHLAVGWFLWVAIIVGCGWNALHFASDTSILLLPISALVVGAFTALFIVAPKHHVARAEVPEARIACDDHPASR